MNKRELAAYIQDYYGIKPDYPWMKHPNHAVFRHPGNRKWFALMMDVPRNKLGLSGSDVLDVVNLKCQSQYLDVLLEEEGFFPGYHMNKAHWVTVALDGSVEDYKIKMILDMSFHATAPKIRKKKEDSN